MYGDIFVDELKKSEVGVILISLLVAQNYRNIDATEIAKKSATVQRLYQRIAIYAAE